MKKLPIIAAVPAYNNADTISELLDELIKQKYDGIFVIDDASSDDTIKVVKSFGSKVKLIEGGQNVGSGANRNRIIGKTPPAIIHFIDADMRLLSKNTPDIIGQIKWPKSAAYIGGMVRNPDGSQNPFNFGPRPHILTGIFQGGLQFVIWLIGRASWPAGKVLRLIFSPLLKGLPNIYINQRPQATYWVAESNMIVKSEEFAKHGGYDPRFRYSEIADFALRIHRKGRHGYFTPNIDVLHLSWDNVLKSGKKRRNAQKQFLEKHGKAAYYFPPLSDYLAGRKTQKRYHK
jgi:GT2 family glycosyltransferase